jgi:N-acyl-L-homoserine lactone synthetase
MVSIVASADRRRFALPLADMHRDRKRVFVDGLGWEVPTVDDEFEIDGFDNEAAVYLLVLDDTGRGHLGSVRLLPTTGPHLLADVFPHLCAEGVPTGPDVWEITRLCTRPGLDDARAVRRQILLALAEFALLHGVRRYTCVTHLPYLSRLLAVGWDCEPLGLPVRHGGTDIGALAITITPATLSLLRARAGIDGSVLDAPARWAA